MSDLQKNENYMLGHVSGGTQENLRLEIQHDAIRHGIMKGRLVHESIPIDMLLGRIADICCGTGVWLNDLAEELTATGHWKTAPPPTFVGFDLTASAFRQDLASNVRLVRHDCCQQFAPEFLGAFDLVNLRGLAYAIPETEFGKLFRNACELLKPGGYIQWLDTESQLWTSTPKTENFTKALSLITEERSSRQLVHYMPDFMIQQYLSLSPHATSKLPNKNNLSLIHFGLTPGGAARGNTAHDTDLNRHLSDIVLETVKLLLEGSLLRERQESPEPSVVGDKWDVAAVERYVRYVTDAQATREIVVSGCFPLLVARKVGPAVSL